MYCIVLMLISRIYFTWPWRHIMYIITRGHKVGGLDHNNPISLSDMSSSPEIKLFKRHGLNSSDLRTKSRGFAMLDEMSVTILNDVWTSHIVCFIFNDESVARYTLRKVPYVSFSLQWCNNECHVILNHCCLDCLLNRFFRRRSRKTPTPRVTGLCEGNSHVCAQIGPCH